MILTVLGSSSAGNCYLLESEGEVLLLECGIPFKRIKEGLDFDYSKVVGCLVTHKHKDHCLSAKQVMEAGINVYASTGTVEQLKIEHHNLNAIRPKEYFNVGSFKILPFEVIHDQDQEEPYKVKEPLGFLICSMKTKELLLFVTDTMYIKYQFKDVNYMVVECNFSHELIEANPRIQAWRKKRTYASHMNLTTLKEYMSNNDLSSCKKIVLIHLSEENGDPKQFKDEIYETTGIDTVVAVPDLVIDLELEPF